MSETEPPRFPVAIWLALVLCVGAAVATTIVWQGEVGEAAEATRAARGRITGPDSGPGLFVGRVASRRAPRQTPSGRTVAGYDAWATVGKNQTIACERFELEGLDLDMGSAKLDIDPLFAQNVKSLTLTPSNGPLCLDLPVQLSETLPEAVEKECGRPTSNRVQYREVVLDEGEKVVVSACRDGSRLVRCDRDRGADFLTASTRDTMLAVWADDALTSVRVIVGLFGVPLFVIGLVASRYAPRAPKRGRVSS